MAHPLSLSFYIGRYPSAAISVGTYHTQDTLIGHVNFVLPFELTKTLTSPSSADNSTSVTCQGLVIPNICAYKSLSLIYSTITYPLDLGKGLINYTDQLHPGTFEHAIHFLIEHQLDLSIFDPSYNNDNTGRPAYAPAILLKIILFAYSKEMISSREIPWSCETNIIFKALSCDTVPHFTTIANFVSGYSNEIERLFEQVTGFTLHEIYIVGKLTIQNTKVRSAGLACSTERALRVA